MASRWRGVGGAGPPSGWSSFGNLMLALSVVPAEGASSTSIIPGGQWIAEGDDETALLVWWTGGAGISVQKRSAAARPKNKLTRRPAKRSHQQSWLASEGVQLRPLTGLSPRHLERLRELARVEPGKSFPSASAAVRYLKDKVAADIKIDHVLTPNERFMGRYSIQKATVTDPGIYGPNNGVYGGPYANGFQGYGPSRRGCGQPAATCPARMGSVRQLRPGNGTPCLDGSARRILDPTRFEEDPWHYQHLGRKKGSNTIGG